MAAASRPRGYEYHYHFSVDDEILSRYQYDLRTGMKTFVFKIKTNFILKKTDGKDQIIDSEKYDTVLYGKGDDDLYVSLNTTETYRLDEYWMSEDERDRFNRVAVDFAKRTAFDPRRAPHLAVPIDVSIEVCTIQQNGELAGPALERAIRAENLVPLYVSPLATAMDRRRTYRTVWCFLRTLSRVRVGDVDEGLGLMRACRICTRAPTIGARITVIPSCGHAFHAICIFRWLEATDLCPSCRSPAYDKRKF